MRTDFIDDGLDAAASPKADILFNKYKQAVFRYALSSVHDFHAAEDIVQEVFLKVYRHISGFRGEASAKTWVFSIARNAITDYKRKQTFDTPYDSDSVLSMNVEGPCERDSFEDIIAVLEPDAQEIIKLRLIAGCKHKDIARLLGCTESVVKMRYSRALQALRQYYGKDGLT